MRLALLQIFLSLKVAKPLNRHPIIKKLNKLNPDVQENNRIIKDLGEGLKNEYLTFKQHNNLFCLGRAILSGELTDDTHREDFKLIGKAIIEQKLNTKAKKLLRKVLLSSKNKARRSLKKLINELKTSGIEENIFQDDTLFQNDGAFSEEAPDSNSKLQIAGFEDADENQIRIRIDTFLKSKETLANNHDQAIITLLRKALVLGNPKGVDNQKVLSLIGNSIETGKPIKFDHQDIIEYLSNVFNAGPPLGKATIEKLAKKHLKGENPSFYVSKKPGSKIIAGKKSSSALHGISALEKNSFHVQYVNQVSHIAKNGSSGGPNSVTVAQNEESETVKTKKSAKPKKQRKSRKGSIKVDVKFNSDSQNTKNKFKNPGKIIKKKLKDQSARLMMLESTNLKRSINKN